jgi:hypothetical protein
VNGYNFHRTILFDSGIDTGFGISVPYLGSYDLRYTSKEYSSQGVLITWGLNTFNVSVNGDNVYTNVQPIDQISGCWPRTTDFPPTDHFTNTDLFKNTEVFTKTELHADIFTIRQPTATQAFTQSSCCPQRRSFFATSFFLFSFSIPLSMK